jgi:hemerythrin
MEEVMEWTNLSTGVATIDEQHRQLVSMINKLVAAIKEQACKYIIGDVIRFLEEYSMNHRVEEELYMQYCRYPEYLLHKAQHNKFINDVIELKKESLNPDPGRKCASYELSVEANRVMVDWVFNHIANEDKKLAAFLNEICPDYINIHHAEHLVHEPA